MNSLLTRRKVLLPIALLVVTALVGLAVGLWTQRHSRDATEPYASIGGEFTLASKDGDVSLSDFRGKVVLMFFGYTLCPDVCPIQLAKIRLALNELSNAEAQQVVGIFVSVDPNRDTPAIVGAYAAIFHERIIGLTGSEKQVSDVAKRYFVPYQKAESDNTTLAYTIDHSATTYLIGRDGRVRKLMRGPNTLEMVRALRDELAS